MDELKFELDIKLIDNDLEVPGYPITNKGIFFIIHAYITNKFSFNA